jgi:hypothetical protein
MYEYISSCLFSLEFVRLKLYTYIMLHERVVKMFTSTKYFSKALDPKKDTRT